MAPSRRSCVADHCFYVDEDTLCAKPVLENLGAEVFTYKDLFSAEELDDGSILDEDWIPRVAERDLVAITRDRKLSSRKRQRDALAAGRVRTFCITVKEDLSDKDIADLISTHAKAIASLASHRDGWFFAHVTKSGVRVHRPVSSKPAQVTRQSTPPSMHRPRRLLLAGKKKRTRK